MLRALFDRTRAVLSLSGKDVREFLQSVVTNDIRRLAPGQPLYAALLSPQGRYLHDFFLIDTGGAILADIAAAEATGFAGRLALYRLRREVRIEAAPLEVVLAWGAGVPPLPAEVLAVTDPRDPGLGQRLYGPDAQAMLAALGAGAGAAATRDERDALRVAHGVPETGIELRPGESFILEMEFERLNGVDFRKGCYVGQEVTARMKHKTELRKGLVRVRIEGTPPPPGTPVMAAGRLAGTLFTVAGAVGLAHLRLDRATEEMEAGGATIRPEG